MSAYSKPRRRSPSRSAVHATLRLRLRASAGPILEEFRELFGHTILERYGMTETIMNISNPYAGERRPGSVGLPLPGVSVRLVSKAARSC